ncbi:hypothetical protein BGZ83_012051 [Gryganskiella cystojenkinii]|nr:hypothetical protein BGZ83_012051 [Gryganskiella cystojenkinii]
MTDVHPSCIHSTSHHNTVSISNSQSASSGGCTCEECARYKAPPQAHNQEQSSSTQELRQQQNYTHSTGKNGGNDRIQSSTATAPTTFIARRPSESGLGRSGGGSSGNSATSPRMQPAGFGGDASAQTAPHQRRASLEFHNRERSFQQHSTACDCAGSGVGCGCAYTCDC